METKKWTQAQADAIDSRGGSVLVSAAAGSGKTAVLVERVAQRVCDTRNPCPVDELLVVTFTQAAAAEMKDRISARLAQLLEAEPENRFLLRQQMLLPSAEICTIDKFCNTLVKRNYSKLGITPDFRILDENERKILARDAADAVIESLYEENTAEFRALTELFISGRTDARLAEILVRLYDNACAYAFPKKWLNSVLALYDSALAPQQTPWGQKILRDVRRQLIYYVQLLKACTALLEDEPELAEKYLPAIESDMRYYKQVYRAAKENDWDKTKHLADSFSAERMGTAPRSYTDSYVKAHVLAVRKKAKDAFAKLAAEIPVTEAEYKEDTAAIKPVMQKLFDAVTDFSARFAALKSEQNAYDFSDVSHMALHLLVSGTDSSGKYIKTELADELSKRYKEILIDEYQDTNRAQDMLFSALSNHEKNLFLVGDVKQSIYGFRLAMPEIFMARRNALPRYVKDNYPAKITLDMNFRSRRGVTDCINYVFSRVMSEEMGGVRYDADEQLIAKNDYPDADFPNAELHVLDLQKFGEEDEQPEAQYIGQRIQKMVDEKMPVQAKGGTRPVRYSDICILLRATTKADVYYTALKAQGIPVFFQKKGGFFSTTEISIMLSFLEIIDNPLQDVPLTAVLMSPIYGFTPDDLAKLRIQQRKGYLFHALKNSPSEKCRQFMAAYEEYRYLSTVLSTENLLRTIYSRTAYPSVVKAMEDGETRRLNLLLLLQYAAEYESNVGPGLTGFIRYLNRTRENKNDLNAAVGVSEQANVVRIMSIHMSKGLEFPVVILADCGKDFNTMAQNERLLIDPAAKLGVGVKRITDGGSRIFETVQRTACKLSMRDSERAEELRILYVAMTRAKERLLMVGSAKNAEKMLAACGLSGAGVQSLPPVLIGKASSFLEILLMVFIGHKDAAVLRALAHLPESIVQPSDFSLHVAYITSLEHAARQPDETCPVQPDTALLAQLEARCTYSYGYAALADYATKISASAVNRSADAEQYYMSAKPSFLCKNEMTPAMRGTATHRFLEICDMENGRLGIDAEINRLTALGKLTREESDAIDRRSLSAFFQSGLYRRIASSRQVYKEQRFTIAVPLTEIDPALPTEFAGEKTIVQGVIDCAFAEDGEIVLVDYKTDRVKNEAELKRRYGPQLAVYKRAAQEIFGLPVRETLLYSLALEKEICLNI